MMKRFIRYVLISVAMLLLFIITLYSLDVNERNRKTDNKTETVTDKKEEKKEETKENKDPLGLSFNTADYLEETVVRNRLANSVLEHCSYVEDRDLSIRYSWVLKSSNKEVYSCVYSCNKKRPNGTQSSASCSIKEGYEDYLSGDKELIRYYVMPEANDNIDMFVYPNSSAYYEKYFILGKYSDMKCSTDKDNAYFEYYWYQNTDSGPMLVYYSTATNYKTTSAYRYNSWLWDLYEESYKNIDIIPYDEYPRTYDYMETYRKWELEKRDRDLEERLKEDIETYCALDDPEDIYYEYEEDFDAYEEALEFWERYCDN